MLDGVTPDMEIAGEETFGPVVPVIEVGSAAQALELTNGSPFGLTAAVFTEDLERGLAFAERARAGWVNINASTNLWESHLPFGGRSGSVSGRGRVGGRFAMETFTEPKTIVYPAPRYGTLTSRHTPTTRKAATNMTMPSALDISRQATLKPVTEIAAEAGLPPWLIEPYGEHVAKIDLKAIEELADRPRARYVLVTAVTPTPLGEGKTTTTIGLGQGMRVIGKRATIALRQASMGPTFGVKGGAAGGGYSQVVPFERVNLHLTGDMHAVTAAHNTLAAMIDNHLFHGNPLGLDPHNITWRGSLT